MDQTPNMDCLFIGGTADGDRLPVNDIRHEYRHHSLAELTNDPRALDDGDPRPEKIAVVEIYLPLVVKLDHAVETVFALNELSDAGIQSQLVKHFGSEVSFEPFRQVPLS